MKEIKIKNKIEIENKINKKKIENLRQIDINRYNFQQFEAVISFLDISSIYNGTN